MQAPPVPLTREQRQELAREAGAKGRSAAPMRTIDRLERYARRGKLTGRQWKRVVSKQRRIDASAVTGFGALHMDKLGGAR